MPSETTKPYHAQIVRYDVENKTLIAKVKDPGDGPEFLEVTMASDRPAPPSKIQPNKYYGGLINKNMEEHLPEGSPVILEDCRDGELSADGTTRRVRTMFVSKLDEASQVLKGTFTIHADGQSVVRLMDDAAINLEDTNALAERFTASQKEDSPGVSGLRFRALIDHGTHYEVVDGSHGFTWMMPALAVQGDGGSEPVPLSKEHALGMAAAYEDYMKSILNPDMPAGLLVLEALPYREIPMSRHLQIRDFSDVGPGILDEEDLGGVFKSSRQIRKAAHVAVRTQLALGLEESNPEREAGALAVDGMVLLSNEDNARRLYAASTPQTVFEKVASHDGRKVIATPYMEGSLHAREKGLAALRRSRESLQKTVGKDSSPSRKKDDALGL